MSRPRARTAIVTLALLALVGVDVTDAVAQDSNLKVWFGRENFVPDDQFKAFMAENPNIGVDFEVVRLEDVAAQLILAMRSGTAPDIVQIHAATVPQLANGGVLHDATELVERMKKDSPETYEQLAPITWSAATHDGNIYGASLHNQGIYLTYRTDWLDEAGVELPLETVDDVLEAARALAAADDRYGFSLIGCCHSPVWEMPLFRSMGGQYVDGVPQIDTEPGHAWINFYQTLIRDGIANPDTLSWDSGEMRSAFIGGRAGMMNEGEHIYVPLHEQIPYAEGKWGFAELPKLAGHEGNSVQSGFGFPYVITTASEDPEAAMLAIEYLARADTIKSVAIDYQPTSNMAVSEDPEYLAAKPWAGDILPLSSQLDPLPSHPTAQIQLYDVLKELREAMIANPDEDPAAMAARYQERLNEAAGG